MKYGCTSPVLTNQPEKACQIQNYDQKESDNFVNDYESKYTEIFFIHIRFYDNAIVLFFISEYIKGTAKSNYCANPCETMKIQFGYPENNADHSNLHESYAKFYFKSLIHVRTSELSMSLSILGAEIGAYFGLLLGFSMLDIMSIIKLITFSKVLSTKYKK